MAVVINQEAPEDEDLDYEEERNESGADGEHDDNEGGDGESGAGESEIGAGRGDDEDGEDEETGHQEEDLPERTRINRERRAQKKLARQERENRYIAELASRDSVITQLQQQINEINRRNVGADLAQIDQQMQQLNNAYIAEQQRMVDAFSSQDGAAHASAVSNMQEIRDRFNNLHRIKQAVEQRQRQPAPLDPRVIQHAQDWKERNSWYDPAQADEDSKVAAMIDNAMAAEGLSPSTAVYWQELDRRLARYLPHRYGNTPRHNGQNGSKPGNAPRQGAIGRTVPVAGGGRAAPGGNGGVRLSPEREQAIREAGLWNDPEKRKKAIAAYRKYDKEQGA